MKQSYQNPESTAGNVGSSRRVLTKNAVLSSILGKLPHDDKGQDDPVTPPDHGGGSSPQVRPKSFVFTMLNPRSKSFEAVSFKWFITLVIIAVS